MRFVFALALLLAQGPIALAAHDSSKRVPPLQCLTIRPSSLPIRLLVGVETIHRDSEKIITIFVPLAPEGSASRVLDTNARGGAGSRRFVMSDGTVRTAFVGVDASPDSRLDACLKELATRAGAQPLEFVRDKLQDDYLKRPPNGFVFPWDRGRKEQAAELTQLFRAAKDMLVGQYPLRSKTTQDVVPLERFLEEGYGTCLHKALLASLLLDKLGIHHRLVNGATRETGHTWIELEDGRILDPSLHKLEKPAPSSALPGWLSYGGTFVFENQVWPYLALD